MDGRVLQLVGGETKSERAAQYAAVRAEVERGDRDRSERRHGAAEVVRQRPRVHGLGAVDVEDEAAVGGDF